MAVWIVTGELGSGKSLMAVQKIQQALMAGRRVATNMDLFLEKLVSGRKRRDVTRLPDWPTVDDLRRIGKGYDGPKFDEKKFGLIVLDELATFMNARESGFGTGGSKEQIQRRLDFLNWLRHARKLRWDLILLTQDIQSLDKQVQQALAEHVVKCRRMDRLSVPIVSTLTKIMGLGAVRLPQVHMGVVRYGSGVNAPIADRWWLPDAKLLHGAYDTQQKILGENDGASTMLDGVTAPYMWKPSGLYELLWDALLRRWFPPSIARQRFDDFRLSGNAAMPSYKPAAQSYDAWWSRKETALHRLDRRRLRSVVTEVVGIDAVCDVAPGDAEAPSHFSHGADARLSPAGAVVVDRARAYA